MATILLFDDDDSLRTALRLTLGHFGHIVIEARNGKEELDLLSGGNAALLITDIVMPEIEGLEVPMVKAADFGSTFTGPRTPSSQFSEIGHDIRRVNFGKLMSAGPES